MAYGEFNGHVTGDVTSPWKVKCCVAYTVYGALRYVALPVMQIGRNVHTVTRAGQNFLGEGVENGRDTFL